MDVEQCSDRRGAGGALNAEGQRLLRMQADRYEPGRLGLADELRRRGRGRCRRSSLKAMKPASPCPHSRRCIHVHIELIVCYLSFRDRTIVPLEVPDGGDRSFSRSRCSFTTGFHLFCAAAPKERDCDRVSAYPVTAAKQPLLGSNPGEAR